MGRRVMVQCNGDRIILLGNKGKRKSYFEKAVSESGLEYKFYSHEELDILRKNEDLSSVILKTDPPVTDSVRIDDLKNFTSRYMKMLGTVSQLPVLEHFNSPDSVAALLDKKKCKQRLINENIPVTHMYDREFSCTDELLDFMAENRIPQIFVKPLTGSGAAGVTAVRFSPSGNRLIAYSCAAVDNGTPVNTKKLTRYENKEAKKLLDVLLLLPCITEKWHAKSRCNGYSYDLRVVMQDGNADYILPRLSKGPVTNLHLNNHAEYYENLGLEEALTEEITDICRRAACCFPGLRSAGIDVLIERGRPYIIEMNGQGDLIYQDIYNENIIYRSQVEIMKKIFKEKEKRYE
ncbi:MAG: STM4014 family protein [Oscillospiraceae bacterium]|nr:STM4014 family protein [Oscillospiraceae bacterium]